jgi:hypothetical protein
MGQIRKMLNLRSEEILHASHQTFQKKEIVAYFNSAGTFLPLKEVFQSSFTM